MLATMSPGKATLAAPAQPQYLSCLTTIELFQGLPATQMEQLNQQLPLVTYQPGAIIYDPNRPVNRLFIVKEGRVKVYRTSSEGKEFTLAVLHPGDIFGQMATLGQQLESSFVQAIEATKLCQLSEQQVAEFLLANEQIARQLLELLAKRVVDLENRLTDLAIKPLPQRLAALLLTTATAGNLPWQKIQQVRLTHEQLASLAGATREAVSKTLAEMSSQGLIKQARGKITILQPQALIQFHQLGCG